MLLDLLNLNIFAFFLIFSRIGSAVAVMPGFSSSFVSARMRLAIALAITFLITPSLAADLPVLPSSTIALILLIAGEVLIGSYLGLIALVILGALQTAGTLIAYSSSMANALVNDPVSQQQSSTISGFLTTTGLVLIFVADFHHLMLRAVVDSYTLFAPGEGLPIADFSSYLARQVAMSFALGLQMAAPAMIVGLTYYVGLGILGRLMPTLQVFFFGLPFQLTAQLWVLAVTVSGILLAFMNRFEGAYSSYVTP
jgi:flagellar biosynthetic protein FliR